MHLFQHLEVVVDSGLANACPVWMHWQVPYFEWGRVFEVRQIRSKLQVSHFVFFMFMRHVKVLEIAPSLRGQNDC